MERILRMNPPSIDKIFLLGYGCLTAVAILTMAISLGTVHWLEVDPDSCYGLFRSCTNGNCDDIKSTYIVDLDKIHATSGLCTTAMLLYALSSLVMGHLLIIRKMQAWSQLHGFLIFGILVFAGVLAIAGLADFVDYFNDFFDKKPYNDYIWNYGYSVRLAIGSVFTAVAAGVCAALAVRYAVKSPITGGAVAFTTGSLAVDMTVPEQPPIYPTSQSDAEYQPSSVGVPKNTVGGTPTTGTHPVEDQQQQSQQQQPQQQPPQQQQSQQPQLQQPQQPLEK